MKILLLTFLTLSALFGAIGEITAVKGVVQLQREAVTLTADRGTKVEVKDLLETQKQSKAQVILNDETIITVGPQSHYLFEAYDDGPEPNVSMRLEYGFFKVVTGKIGKIAPERFKVKTKAATIGIRGTQFVVSVQGETEKIGCNRGALVVETEKTTFDLPAGRMLVYENHEWAMYVLDQTAFEPVMVQGGTKTETPLEKNTEFLPDFSDSYTPMEQLIDKAHGPGI